MWNLRSVAVVAAAFALGGCVTIKHTLPPEGRQVEGGRNLLVTVTQNELIAGIQESNISAATGGGLLFALIDAGVNQARTKTAEEAIVPVRDALADYSFDQKAIAASQEIAQRVTWLGVQKSELNKDPSNARLSKAIDETPGPELLSITYDYLLDNNFTVLKVGANVSLLPKALPKNKKPESRALLMNATFNRGVVCVLPLGPGATDEIEKNAPLWAQDGGRSTEEKLNQALAKIVELVPKALERTAEQDKAVKGKNESMHGYFGKVVDTDADGTLLVNNFGQWIYVFKAPSST
jgi:hypothetical protein